MRIWVISDLHLEFADWRPAPPDADVCVVAGDVLTRGPEHSLEWLAQHIARRMPVVFTAGNHEFYDTASTWRGGAPGTCGCPACTSSTTGRSSSAA